VKPKTKNGLPSRSEWEAAGFTVPAELCKTETTEIPMQGATLAERMASGGDLHEIYALAIEETPAPVAGHTPEYRWVPEGDGFTLYHVRYGAHWKNCGRLNTDATGSTHRLATLYNDAPRLLHERDKAVNGEAQALVACERMRRENEALREALQNMLDYTIWNDNHRLHKLGQIENQARAALALCESGVQS
jgi:hypothetical protein